LRFLIAALLAPLTIAACSKAVPSAEYLAACEGPPLRSVERRQKALEDGYDVIRMHDCISKESFVAVAAQKARWEAANTPEAKALKQAEWDAAKAADDARRAAEPKVEPPAPEPFVMRVIDINTASESDLASIPSLTPDVVAQITDERKKGRFKGWEDVVRRVVALSAAQTAMYASVSGLTVDGESLSGAPPNAQMAAAIREKYRRY